MSGKGVIFYFRLFLYKCLPKSLVSFPSITFKELREINIVSWQESLRWCVNELTRRIWMLKPEKTEALQKQYDAYIEADKKRKERNEYILWRMNAMQSLSHGTQLQLQVNPSFYRHNYYSNPHLHEVYHKGASTSNQISHNIPSLKVCDDAILREISKDFILIPKHRRHDLTDDGFNLLKSAADQNADWKSKYQILDKLKQIEKENVDVPVRDETNMNLVDPKIDRPLLNTLKSENPIKQSRSEIYEYKQEQASEIIYGIPVDKNDKREIIRMYNTSAIAHQSDPVTVNTVTDCRSSDAPEVTTPDTGEVTQNNGIFSTKYKAQPVNSSVHQRTLEGVKESILTANALPNTSNVKENSIDNKYENTEPIEIINVADFTPYEGVELKDGHNINPVYEHTKIVAEGYDTSIQNIMEPAVMELKQPTQDSNIEGETELEAESKMFYQEQPDYQNNTEDVEYDKNVQENYQDEYHAYYEQKQAEAAPLGEYDETNQKYDQNYEQQYNNTYDTEGSVEQPAQYNIEYNTEDHLEQNAQFNNVYDTEGHLEQNSEYDNTYDTQEPVEQPAQYNTEGQVELPPQYDNTDGYVQQPAQFNTEGYVDHAAEYMQVDYAQNDPSQAQYLANDGQQQSSVALGLQEGYDNLLTQGYETQEAIDQQLNHEQGYVVPEEGYEVEREIYDTNILEQQTADQLDNVIAEQHATGQMQPIMAEGHTTGQLQPLVAEEHATGQLQPLPLVGELQPLDQFQPVVAQLQADETEH